MAQKITAFIASMGLVLIVLAFVLFENSSDLKIGYTQAYSNNDWYASFDYFQGFDDKILTTAKDGKIVLTYCLELEKGVMEMRIKDETGSEIAQMVGGSGEIAFTVAGEQNYSIEVEGKEAKGNYQFTWNTIDL